jgi:hypothetical protein
MMQNRASKSNYKIGHQKSIIEYQNLSFREFLEFWAPVPDDVK